MRNLKIGIIGHGQIGKAIEDLYNCNGVICDIYDIGLDLNEMYNCDIIHICIPYDEYFVDACAKYMETLKPEITIINSTVQVGTTRQLEKFGKVAHSPIRGVHPKLLRGIQTFKMFVGTNDPYVGEIVANHYTDLGTGSVVICKSSETTELAKLLDTTYYGLCIAFHKEAKALCDEVGVDFEYAMTEYNSSYNAGYEHLGKREVMRPVLQDMPGPIGGHCVVPNAKILQKIWDSEVLSLIGKYE
jgi:UDP-N-acetyl-D-mannosaminuronate dehydrogenase